MDSGSRPSFSKQFEEFRPSKTALFWACAACVAVTLVLGFTWGGWVTGGTAQEMAEEASEDAHAQLAAAICVQQFMSGIETRAQLVELQDLPSYRQDDFVADGGWATMPGSEEPSAAGADLCAEQLAVHELPPAQEASTPNDGATVAQ